ncbi:MAG: hypothetical protein LBG84_03800 [Treponema sp.]|jgi:hypothetical protein|nr:hypothetical protein [Treponema sp.]
MTIEQTVEIPPANGRDRRLIIDVPPEVPEGRTILAFTPVQEDETEYLLRSPANRERLMQAVDDTENGRNLITFKTLEDALHRVRDRLPRNQL